MGFDMNMRVRPPTAIVGYEPQYPDDPGYFRIVQHGMPLMCLFMAVADVLDDELPYPAMPPWPPVGIDGERANALASNVTMVEPPPSDAERATLAVWSSRSELALATSSPKPGRVPTFKFVSNMGWSISADEARAIANALDRAIADRPDGLQNALASFKGEGTRLRDDEAFVWIRRWARYNAVAATHGGGYRID